MLAALLLYAFWPAARPAFAQSALRRAAGPEAPLAVPDQVLLKAPAGSSDADVQALAARAGCSVAGRLEYVPGWYVLRLNGTAGENVPRQAVFTPVSDTVNAAITTLQQTPGVVAEPNYRRTLDQVATTAPPRAIPNDPFFPDSGSVAVSRQQWHMDMIRAPEAWGIQLGVRPVVACVIDTGCDIQHPDFLDVDGKTSRLILGTVARNFYDNGLDPTKPVDNNVDDPGFHGTHVSGTVAATTNNGIGVTGVAGWNNGGVNVRILPLRVFGATGGTTAAAVANAIGYAAGLTNPRVDVINLSLGSPAQSSAEAAAVSQAVAANIVLVASAGNEATIGTRYPADYPSVIKVSALGPDRRLASYSNSGGAVAIAAPGGDGPFKTNLDVLSTWPLDQTTGANGEGIVAPGYHSIDGTSMAAPHVSGVVALVLAAGARPQDIRAIIQSTAQPLDETPDPRGGNKYGAGLIDAYAALLPFASPVVRLASPQNNTETLLRTITIQVAVQGIARLARPSDLTIDVRTATLPSRPLVPTLVGGRDFVVPAAPDPSNPLIPAIITITIPATEGQYVVEAKLNDARRPTSDIRFVTVRTRQQAQGRALFAVPFTLNPTTAGVSREVGLFNGTTFRLARWDSQFTYTGSASDLDPYAYFFSDGSRSDVRASFTPSQGQGVPLTFDTTASNPNSPSASVEPVGLGFWLDLGAQQALNTTGGAPVVNPVGIRLFTEKTLPNGAVQNPGGWNLIGAPFTFPVDWNAVSVQYNGTSYRLEEAVAQNVIRPALIGYANGDYYFQIAPLGQLQPFNGYWVRALQDCILIVPPAASALGTVPGAGSRAVARPASRVSNRGWRVRLQASVDGDRDGQNYFGQAPGAQAGDDALDMAKPPSGAGHAYVRFLQKSASNGRATTSAFAFDIRDERSAREQWTAAVTTDRANANVTLSWEGLPTLPRNARLTLVDSATGKRVALRSRSSYTFRSGEAGETRLFTIVRENQASAGPFAISNVAVTQTRAVRGAAIRFNVSHEAEIVGAVKTIGGALVATMGGSGTRAVKGRQATLHWDGTTSRGAAVPAGPYVLELTGRTPDGETVSVKRPLLYIR